MAAAAAAATSAATKAAYTAAAATVAAAGVGAYASYQQGQSQKSWNEYNAGIARMKAASEQEAALASAERMRMQNEQLRAKQRLAYGLSGVTLAGTPTDLLADTAAMQELDIDTLLWNANAKSTYSAAGAELLDLQGGAAGRAGTIGAGVNLLQGMTQVSQQYSENQRWEALTAKKG
jgi:hypothetical protein